MKYPIKYDNSGGAAASSVITKRELAIKIKNKVVPRPLDYFKDISVIYDKFNKVMVFDSKILKDIPEFLTDSKNMTILANFIEELEKINTFILDKTKTVEERNEKVDEYIKKYDDMILLVNKDKIDNLVIQMEEVYKKHGSKISDIELAKDFSDGQTDDDDVKKSYESDGSDIDGDFM